MGDFFILFREWQLTWEFSPGIRHRQIRCFIWFSQLCEMKDIVSTWENWGQTEWLPECRAVAKGRGSLVRWSPKLHHVTVSGALTLCRFLAVSQSLCLSSSHTRAHTHTDHGLRQVWSFVILDGLLMVTFWWNRVMARMYVAVDLDTSSHFFHDEVCSIGLVLFWTWIV